MMKTPVTPKLIAACLLITGATAAFCHVVLQDSAAATGASYRATFKVGHGCDGAPTTGIRVSIPAGFRGAQPMPKPGWTLYTQVGKLAQPTTAHGKVFTEGILEIRWEANGPANALPSEFYDEFVLRGTTPSRPGPLWFKVLQTCEKGENAWVEIPVSGTSTQGLKAPAVLLDVLDIQATGHAH